MSYIKSLFFLAVLLHFFISASTSHANENLAFDSYVEYKVHEDGGTSVTNTINMKNTTSLSYAQSFILNFSSFKPVNLKAYEAGLPLKATYVDNHNKSQLKIDFPEPVVGINNSRTFVITYKTDSLVEKTGDVWEVSIPRLDNSEIFSKYKVSLSIPQSFGSEAYVSPEPRKIEAEDGRIKYFFEKDDIKTYGVVVGFGQSQVYEFSLNFHLENPLKKSEASFIAIPPDTNLQKVYYEKIEPKPYNVSVDEDGNWLATYNLSPRQKLDVVVKGAVQIFAKPRKFLIPSPATLLQNTKPSDFWQTEDMEIRRLAQELKTPKAIYDYVTNRLTYNYQRVKPETIRLGAREALANPTSAICTEFTDTFVALARAAGIPAREINGYAYTQNPELQPLSLVADVLHAWPEYWDEKKGVWVGVDPTWGATSKVDFFNKLDLRHITFVIHGQNPSQPFPPGSYKFGKEPQKDVYVFLGEVPRERTSSVKIKALPQKTPFLFGKKLNITVQNEGSVAVYDITPTVYFDERPVRKSYISVLPPYSKVTTEIKIPYGILGTKAPEEVKILSYRSEVALPANRSQAIIYQLAFLCIILLTSLALFYKKTSKKVLRSFTFNLKLKILKIYGKAFTKIATFKRNSG